MTKAPGTLIDERYEIIDLIGEGGSGTVFKAREVGTERIVALKFLHSTLVSDPESFDRFKREGDLLSRLEHPSILRCYRFGIWKNQHPYISMEYLSGIPLSSTHGLSPTRAIAIVQQVCHAMAHAHSLGVIHRDLKPSNIILVTESGGEVIKVVDFGLGKLATGLNTVSQHLTQTGTLLGSIFYMSPEQCVGRKADVRSDIYSLGCVLYELLAGTPPFVADTPIGLMHKHTTVPPQRLNKTDLPAGTNAVTLRSLAKRPEDRYQSMTDFGDELGLILAGTGHQLSEFVENRPVATSNRMQRIVLLLAMFVVIGAAMIALRARDSLETSTLLVPRELVARPDLYQQATGDQLKTWIRRFGKNDPRGTALAHMRLGALDREHEIEYTTIAQNELTAILRGNDAPDLWGWYSNESLLCNLMVIKGNAQGPESEYECYLEFRKHLQEPRPAARFLAKKLDDLGLYAQEGEVWKSLQKKTIVDLCLYARCLNRQNKPISIPPLKQILCYREQDSLHLEHAAKALIELNKPELARALLTRNANAFAAEPMLAAYCLTMQKQYTRAEADLLNCWKEEQRGFDSRRVDRCRSVFILAALIHNCAAQHTAVTDRIKELTTELAGDPEATTLLAYLCSKDDPAMSETLALNAMRCYTDASITQHTDRKIVNAIILLSKTMNDIKRPLITRKLLEQVSTRVEDRSLSLWANGELVRSLLQSGEIQRANGLSNKCIGRCIANPSPMPFPSRNILLIMVGQICDSVSIQVQGQNPAAALKAINWGGTILKDNLLPVYSRVELLERLAGLARKAGDENLALNLQAFADRLLPQHSRGPWHNWDDLNENTYLF